MSKLNEIREILGMQSEDLKIVTITPEMARELVKFNTKNRARQKQREKEYASDMKEGKFQLSESMIGFGSNGELTNGQGRLYSCIEANVPFQSVVCLSLEQNIHMDTGRVRKTVDNIKLSEVLNGVCNDHADTITTIKELLRLASNKGRVRDEEVVDFCKKYADTIDRTFELGLLNLHGGKKAVFKSDMAAAFLVAAINGVDLNKLVHIRNMLTDGMSVDKKDKVILNYREKAFELSQHTSGTTRKQRYFGLQNVIYCYVNGKKSSQVIVDREYYPLIF